MSAAQIGDRAAHVNAFALLVQDGLIEKRTAMNALMRRDYFTPPQDRESTKEPPGYKTARGNAWLIDTGSLTYSEGTYLVARTIRASSRVDIEAALVMAERLLARTLKEIDEQRRKAGGELDAAMRRLQGPTQASQRAPAHAPTSPTATPRLAGPL